jgi:hypothetical protein
MDESYFDVSGSSLGGFFRLFISSEKIVTVDRADAFRRRGARFGLTPSTM